MEPSDAPSLLGLPAEVIQHILSYCSPVHLTRVALVCHRLYAQAYDDRLWQAFIHRNIHQSISEPKPLNSFRKLYIAHHPHWFLPRNRLWYADSEPSGKLLVSRFDPQRGCIEAHAVTARKGSRTWEFWEKDSEVMIHHFNPIVSVDLTRPAMKLDVDSLKTDDEVNSSASDASNSPPSRYGKETLMETFADAGLYGSFMLCRTLPEVAIAENTQVWPPMRFEANSRTRCKSSDGFKSVGHRPTKLDEVSDSTFRLRKWVEYSGRRSSPTVLTFSSSASGLAAAFGISGSQLGTNPNAAEMSSTRIRVPEDITTYASLPLSSYTPTPQKPWQGIWVGDYSGHGCEFLLLTQPDKEDEKPLPAGMKWLQDWFSGERDTVVMDQTENYSDDSEYETDSAGEEQPITIPIKSESPSNPRSRLSSPTSIDNFSNDPYPPSGRIEAIKLTGDPNIPRGEYTWIAPDIGDGGLIRVADEAAFRGARVVKSGGHMAGRGFRADSYTPSQLILVSHDTVAQFWEGFGHISYFKRVDLEALSKTY